MKDPKRYIALIIGVILIASLPSCEDLFNQDCLSNEPDWTEVNFKFTTGGLNDTILMVLYRGDTDNEDVIDSFSIWGDEFAWELEVNQYYSAKAFYKTIDGEVIVVDGTEPQTVNNADEYGDCWKVRNDEIILQLMP